MIEAPPVRIDIKYEAEAVREKVTAYCPSAVYATDTAGDTWTSSSATGCEIVKENVEEESAVRAFPYESRPCTTY